MGITTTPRHRAERPRGIAWPELRRSVAHVLAGRDLYADDLVLRQRTVDVLDDETVWSDLQPSARVAHRTASV